MDSLKENLSKLKFISKIQKGDKINVRYLYVQPSGFLTSLSRSFFYQDNRGNTLNFVHNTIYKTFEIIDNLENNNNNNTIEKALGNNITYDLENSKNGLLNLKETYIEDIKFCCDIDTLIQLIDAKIQVTSIL